MPKPDSPLGRTVQRVAGSPLFLKSIARVVPRLDRAVYRLTGGKRIMSGGVVPTLVLHTTGAKSGQPRTTPLATMPDGDSFYVVGSNFGQEKHPAWSANLLANPEATVSFHGRTTPVHAHLLSPDEKQQVWPKLLTVWPNYDKYVELSGGRDLRVFRLEPRSG